MTARKRAIAFTTAVFLAATTISSPAAASVQEILPESLPQVTVSEDQVSVGQISVDGIPDLPDQSMQGVSGDFLQAGPSADEGTDGDGQGPSEELEGSEDLEGAGGDGGGPVEMIQEEMQENSVSDGDQDGYTGRVPLEDLQDQEKLDKALADGLVELIPDTEEIYGDDQRAGAGVGNIIDAALREVGVSGRPNKYTYWLGAISGTYSYAWCHAFVSWCGAQISGAGQIPRTASCFYGAQEFKARGQWKDRISGYVPKAGDIIYFDWDANGGYDHVGIVHYVSGGRVHTIEGNAGDAVRLDGGRTAGYALTDIQIIGYGTPQTSTAPQVRGCLDAVTGGDNSVHVKGWAFDENDLAQSLDIHVYVGGPAGSGAPGYTVRADKTREDVDMVYPGVGEEHGFDATVAVSRTGDQPVYVYAVSIGDKDPNPMLGSSTVNIKEDKERPVIADVEVSDISAEGYMVTCEVSDNVGIKKVEFPSWHDTQTEEQAVRFNGTVEDGVAECYIPIAELGGQSGTYTTRICAYDMVGNQSTATAKEVSIDLTALDQYEAKNISTDFIARIENEGSGRVLTGLTDSMTVVGRTDTGADDQIWRFVRDDDYGYTIQLKSNSAYLSVSAPSTGGDARAALQAGQGEEQIWQVLQAGEDTYYLNPKDEKISVLGQGGEGDSEMVCMQAFDTTAGQRFRIQKLSTNVKSLTLNKSEITFTEALQTAKLKATIKPKRAADEKIRWATSDEKVATVDKRGKVTAIGNGTADISAATEDGSISVICKVTVDIKVTGVKLDKQQIKLEKKGAVQKLSAAVTPSNAKDRAVTWSSSDKKVASVDQSGNVKAVANGTAVITAETVDGKRSAVCNATVQIPRVGAGGTVKNGSYTYTADHIIGTTGSTTVIYRQKKGKSKEKLTQIGAKAYLRLMTGKKLYFEKAVTKSRRDLYAMDIRTSKKQLVRTDTTIVSSRGKKFLVRPYAAKVKPQPYSILNVSTGRATQIARKCLAASMTKSRVYYVEALSKRAGKGWTANVRSCDLSAGKGRTLTGKITVGACEEITSKKIVYKSGKTWYQYTYATKKKKKVDL